MPCCDGTVNDVPLSLHVQLGPHRGVLYEPGNDVAPGQNLGATLPNDAVANQNISAAGVNVGCLYVAAHEYIAHRFYAATGPNVLLDMNRAFGLDISDVALHTSLDMSGLGYG